MIGYLYRLVRRSRRDARDLGISTKEALDVNLRGDRVRLEEAAKGLDLYESIEPDPNPWRDDEPEGTTVVHRKRSEPIGRVLDVRETEHGLEYDLEIDEKTRRKLDELRWRRENGIENVISAPIEIERKPHATDPDLDVVVYLADGWLGEYCFVEIERRETDG